MDKKIIAIIALVIIGIAVVAIAFTDSVATDSSNKPNNRNNSYNESGDRSDSSDKSNYTRLSSANYKNFIRFEAEMGCLILGAKNEEEAKKVADNADRVAEQHGLTRKEIESFEQQYKNNNETKQEVLAEMQKMCSDKLEVQEQKQPIKVN
jgi:hypothetical protein